MGCRVGRFSHLVMNPRLRLEAVTEGWKDMKSRTDCGASHIQRNTKAEVHSTETCPTLCIFVENNSYRSKHNDPKYTSKLCNNYSETKEETGVLTVMDFPPQSADLNPTENLWGALKAWPKLSIPDIRRSSLKHCQITQGLRRVIGFCTNLWSSGSLRAAVNKSEKCANILGHCSEIQVLITLITAMH